MLEPEIRSGLLLVLSLIYGLGCPVGLAGVARPESRMAPATQQPPAQQPPAAGLESQRPELVPGLCLRLYRVPGPLAKLPSLAPDQTPNLDLCVREIGWPPEASSAALPGPICGSLSGWIELPEQGLWRFRLTSDDGSRLWLAGECVLDHDGNHAATSLISAPRELPAGAHALRLDYFDAGGARELKLEWQSPGAADFSAIPPSALRTELDLARVTSPGIKRLVDHSAPGDGRALEAVHPGWRLEAIRPPGFEPKVSALCCLPDGRLVVGSFAPLQRDDTSLPDIESKAPDQLHALSNLQAASPDAIEAKVCASDLFEPLGLCVLDGALYVAHRKAVTRLTDLDSDGFFETHTDVASGWEAWNYHQFTFQLVPRRGRLYTALSTAMAPPGWEGMGTNAAPNGLLRGAILEIDPLTGSWSAIAGGTRTPNGLGLGPEDVLLYLDNQGTWMPTSQAAEVLPGSFYGHYNNTRFVPQLAQRFPGGGLPSIYADHPRAPGALYLPHGELSNSPSEPVLIESGPWKDQVLIGELTGGGIQRACLERVNGDLQGAVMRFTGGLEVGINRLCFGPDGALYVGGLGAQGNWNWRGTQFGLQRLVPTGVPVFEIERVHLRAEGLEVRFSAAIDGTSLKQAGAITAHAWHYLPTSAYGGEPQGLQALEFSAELTASPARAPAGAGVAGSRPEPESARELLLRLPGLRALPSGSVVHLRLALRSADGAALWSPDAYYTLNALPAPGSRAWLPGEAGFRRGQSFRCFDELASPTPPGDGLFLVGTGSSAHWKLPGNQPSPSGGLSQDDLLASGGELQLPAGARLESRGAFAGLGLHLEFCLEAQSSEAAQAVFELELPGGYLLRCGPAQAPTETKESNPGSAPAPVMGLDAAFDGSWHTLVLELRSGGDQPSRELIDSTDRPAKGPEIMPQTRRSLRLALDGERQTERFLGDAAALEPGPLRLALTGPRSARVRLRNTWIMPLQSSPEDFTGAWTNIEPAGNGAQAPEFEPRGGQASFRWEQQAGTWVLVGTSAADTANTFLTSAAEFGDFELEFEVRQDPRLNSGVQLRSQVEGGFKYRQGRLIGYQVELDGSPRAYTGGIYEESGRGWLHPLSDNPAARAAYRPGEWNRIRVLARGALLQTWVNGVPAGELLDELRRRGHLAFQVHSVGSTSEPLSVAWRRIRLRVD